MINRITNIQKIVQFTLCSLTSLLALSHICAAGNVANTAPAEPAKVAYKFTTTYLRASDYNDAIDLNLRANYAVHTAWVGEYGDKQGFRQLRAGYEYSPEFTLIRPTLSVQIASKGYVAGSITTEIGEKNFAIFGIARTNLQEYYDLGHDPSDAVTLGIGSRGIENNEISLFQVFDDRLKTQQRNNHLVWRYKFSDEERISIDASYKTGLTTDNVFIHGYGLSADYRYKQYFARIARDEYANFNPSHQTRFSAGFHF